MPTKKVNRNKVSDEYAAGYAEGGAQADKQVEELEGQLEASETEVKRLTEELQELRDTNERLRTAVVSANNRETKHLLEIRELQHRIKHMEGAEQKYVGTAAKLVNAERDLDHLNAQYSDLRRNQRNAIQLLKTTQVTIESVLGLIER